MGRIEKKGENSIWCCLVRRERMEIFWWGPCIFFPAPPKCNFPKMGRKLDQLFGQKFPSLQCSFPYFSCFSSLFLYCAKFTNFSVQRSY